MSHLTSLPLSNDASLSKSNKCDSITPDVRVGDKSNVSNKVLGLRLVDEGTTQIIKKDFNITLRNGLKILIIKDPNFSELHLNERQKISQLEVLDLSGNRKMGTYGLSSIICATEKNT